MWSINSITSLKFWRGIVKLGMLASALSVLVSCGGSETPENNEFVVVEKITVGPLDNSLALKGKQLFEAKCTACHKYDTRLVGPALGDVVNRRSPEYILSMITAPDKMLLNNDTTKALLRIYMTQMTNQNVTLDDAKAIFEHLRDISNSK